MKHLYYYIGVLISLCISTSNYAEPMIGGTAKSIDLELNYLAAPTEYSIFTDHLFILTITNSGPDNATGVSIYAPFPSNVLAYTDSEASQGDYSVWTGVWQVGELASGESATLDLTLFVLNVSGEVSLFAQVQTANEEDIDSTPNNNLTQIPAEDDEAIVTITRLGGGDGGGNNGSQEVDIELSMTANHNEVNVGKQFTYILSASNVSENAATGVKVYFPIPEQLEYVDSSNGETTYDPNSGEWSIGNLPKNATRSILIDVEVKIGGTITVFAEVLAANEMDSDSTPNNRVVEEDDYFSLDILGLQIDLELWITLPENSTDIVPIGGNVTFLVHVENKGPTVGYNSKIRAILPEGFEYVRNMVTMGEYLDDLGVWVIGDIPAFEVQTMELTARVTAEGPLTFTCEVRTSNVPDVDSMPSNFDPDEDDIDSITIDTDVGTSVETLEEIAATFSAHPIPSNGIVFLQFNSGFVKDMNLTIYDLSGKTLYQKPLQTIIGGNQLEIDLTAFPQGMYWLSLETDKTSFVRKVLKD